MSRKIVSFTPLLPRHSPPPPSARAASSPPGKPFYHDPAHTIPTKWSLYRPLLRSVGGPSTLASLAEVSSTKSDPAAVPFRSDLSRDTPDPDLRPRRGRPDTNPFLVAYIRDNWRRNRSLTSIPQTIKLLRNEYGLLDAVQDPFVLAKLDASAQSVHLTQAGREANQTSVKRSDSPVMTSNYSDADTNTPNEQDETTAGRPRRRRGLLTGGFLRPSAFNPPLPRLKPQPIGISMMIHNRLRARERRVAARRTLVERAEDMQAEVAFWNELGEGASGVSSYGGAYTTESWPKNVPADSTSDTPTAATTATSPEATKVGRTADAATSRAHIKSEVATWSTGPSDRSWHIEMTRHLRLMDNTFKREAARAAEKFDPELVKRVTAARRRRQEWLRERKM